MDTIMIEATVEHFVEGKGETELAKLAEEYVMSVGVIEYRTRFEQLTAQKFKSKWADTIELTVTQLDKDGRTIMDQDFANLNTPIRKVLYPHGEF